MAYAWVEYASGESEIKKQEKRGVMTGGNPESHYNGREDLGTLRSRRGILRLGAGRGGEPTFTILGLKKKSRRPFSYRNLANDDLHKRTRKGKKNLKTLKGEGNILEGET